MLAIDVTADPPVIIAFATLPNPSATSKAIFVSSDDHVWVPATTIFAVYEFTPDLELIAVHNTENLGITTCEGILVDQAGNLYLSERTGSAGMVKLIPTDTGWQRDIKWGVQGAAELGGDVRMATINAAGTIYVGVRSGSVASQIFTLDANGTKEFFVNNLVPPLQLATDAQGMIYSINYSADPILTIMSPSGELVDTYNKTELRINTPGSGIAVTKDGQKLYILDEQDITVRIYRWVD